MLLQTLRSGAVGLPAIGPLTDMWLPPLLHRMQCAVLYQRQASCLAMPLPARLSLSRILEPNLDCAWDLNLFCGEKKGDEH